MKKTLKYSVVSTDVNGIYIQIIEQSHLGKDFGKDATHMFEASNGIIISSYNMPSFGKVDHDSFLFVWGNECNKNDREVFIPFMYLKSVFAAIQEYNDFDFPEKVVEYPIYFVRVNGGWPRTAFIKFTDRNTGFYYFKDGGIERCTGFFDNIYNMLSNKESRQATKEEAYDLVTDIKFPIYFGNPKDLTDCTGITRFDSFTHEVRYLNKDGRETHMDWKNSELFFKYLYESANGSVRITEKQYRTVIVTLNDKFDRIKDKLTKACDDVALFVKQNPKYRYDVEYYLKSVIRKL